MQAIREGEAIYAQGDILSTIERVGIKGEEKPPIETEKLQPLKELWMDKLRSLLSINHKKCARMLFLWSNWGNQKEIKEWKEAFENEGFEVIVYPVSIPKQNLKKEYPVVHKNFFKSLTNTDILFVLNEDKKGIKGYIGAEVFAEMAFAVALNLVYEKNIKIWLLKEPSRETQSYDEIKLWLELGWIELYKKSKLLKQ